MPASVRRRVERSRRPARQRGRAKRKRVTSNDGGDRPIGGIEPFATPHTAATTRTTQSDDDNEEISRYRRERSGASRLRWSVAGCEAVPRVETHTVGRTGERSELGVATEHRRRQMATPWSIGTSPRRDGFLRHAPRRRIEVCMGNQKMVLAGGCSPLCYRRGDLDEYIHPLILAAPRYPDVTPCAIFVTSMRSSRNRARSIPFFSFSPSPPRGRKKRIPGYT